MSINAQPDKLSTKTKLFYGIGDLGAAALAWVVWMRSWVKNCFIRLRRNATLAPVLRPKR